MTIIGHDYTGHDYIGHYYIGHGYIGHDCIGHSCIGHNYIGHNYKDRPTSSAGRIEGGGGRPFELELGCNNSISSTSGY